MGRMLETMKLGQARHTPLAISKPIDETPVQPCVTDWEIAEEVPFVEPGETCAASRAAAAAQADREDEKRDVDGYAACKRGL
jgi:hypothetical protein